MSSMPKSLSIFCDGGSRGNPGPAAIGFLVKDHQGKILVRKGKVIGWTTNNVAEYTAVIEALKWICQKSRIPTSSRRSRERVNNHQSQINFFLDSKLVVNQLNGLFRIKNAKLRNLIVEVRQLEKAIGGYVFYHFVPREKNRDADFLVNQALKNLR